MIRIYILLSKKQMTCIISCVINTLCVYLLLINGLTQICHCFKRRLYQGFYFFLISRLFPNNFLIYLKAIVMLHDNVYQLYLLEYTVLLFFVISDTKHANVTKFPSDEQEYNNFSKRYEYRRSLILLFIWLILPVVIHLS